MPGQELEIPAEVLEIGITCPFEVLNLETVLARYVLLDMTKHLLTIQDIVAGISIKLDGRIQPKNVIFGIQGHLFSFNKSILVGVEHAYELIAFKRTHPSCFFSYLFKLFQPFFAFFFFILNQSCDVSSERAGIRFLTYFTEFVFFFLLVFLDVVRIK